MEAALVNSAVKQRSMTGYGTFWSVDADAFISLFLSVSEV